jgi:hypothetical protein
MTTDPMTLAQIRDSEALQDAIDALRPGQSLVIRRTATGEIEASNRRVELAIRHVRALEAQEQEVGR